MKFENPEAAGTASTTQFVSSAENDFGSPETVSCDCLCCSTDQFRFVEHLRSEGETWARFKCVGCGATRDRRVPSPRGEGR